MKLLKKLSLAILLVFTVVLTNCGPNDPDGKDKVNALKEQAQDLAGTWNLSANGAELEGDPVAGWDSFTLTFDGDEDGGTFSTSGAGSSDVWPSSGTWVFAEASNGSIDPGTIERNDGVTIDISALTNSQLILVFTFDESSNQRIRSVSGNWDFSLER